MTIDVLGTLIDRLTDCLTQLEPYLSDDLTVDVAMVLMRDKFNSYQVQIKLLKDPDEFMETEHGELIVKGYGEGY